MDAVVEPTRGKAAPRRERSHDADCLLAGRRGGAAVGGGYNSPPQPRTGPPPPPPEVGIDQRLGERVPLDLPFRDEDGRGVTLGDCTAGKPTVLVLAYYRCPMLCTEVLNGLLRALRALPDDGGRRRSTWWSVSFDPREKPPLAALKKASYLEEYGRPGADAGWHFLTGDPLADRRASRTPSGSATGTTRTPSSTPTAAGSWSWPRTAPCRRYLLGRRASSPATCGSPWPRRPTGKVGRRPTRCCCSATATTRRPGRTRSPILRLVRAG